MLNRHVYLCIAILILAGDRCVGQPPKADTSPGDAMLAKYFREETEKITKDCLSEIKTLDDWTGRRDQYRLQLLEMLGLDPMPARTPLNPVVTDKIEKDGVVVENLQFQSMPGLYVTGNLYRPLEQDGPLPAILYVCGHGGVKKNGVSLGNKTHYQHHGAWFARNGYVCLTIDTIQLGEIEGLHHGTYREGMWWWNNRGYTPAGVEAWNCVRSIDYLQTRPEVDPKRLGVTGRSGGGAYSWWSAAIDDRIQVAVPVAGIASLKNHVVDGCVEGHCDCMYMVNTYRWDYPLVAALVAPRPLLISNTDKDRIFPLDGVIDVHTKVKRIYDLYDASDHLGLQITEGPHKDTQELRVHAFRWFNRFLKGKDELLQFPAVAMFAQEDLKVFQELPENERVTSIHESFVPSVATGSLPKSRSDLEQSAAGWMRSLREKTFRGWPENQKLPSIIRRQLIRKQEIELGIFNFESQEPFELQMFVLSRPGRDARNVSVRVLNQSDWESVSEGLAALFGETFPDFVPDQSSWDELEQQLDRETTVLVLPRGVGPSQWNRNDRKRVQIRRRFMQLGQTLAGMQIYDVVQALRLIQSTPELRPDRLRLVAGGEAASWALFASLFVDKIDEMHLSELPVANRNAPDLLNVSRYVETPHVALMAANRVGGLLLRDQDDNKRRAWQAIRQKNDLANELITISENEVAR